MQEADDQSEGKTVRGAQEESWSAARGGESARLVYSQGVCLLCNYILSAHRICF